MSAEYEYKSDWELLDELVDYVNTGEELDKIHRLISELREDEDLSADIRMGSDENDIRIQGEGENMVLKNAMVTSVHVTPPFGQRGSVPQTTGDVQVELELIGTEVHKGP